MDRRLPAFVIGGLIILAALTVAGALAAAADGAHRPATIASVPVAVAVVLGAAWALSEPHSPPHTPRRNHPDTCVPLQSRSSGRHYVTVIVR